MLFTDLYLIHRARAGDRRAFDSLYDRNVSRIYNLLRRLSNDTSRAEDLTQETFVCAYQSLPQWKGLGKFSSWLCGIAVHCYKNDLRRHRSEFFDEPLDESLSALPDSDPFARMDRAQTRQMLSEAIAALPEPCRIAFVLVYVEEISYKESAALLDIPIGTVQSRLHRAKRLLHIQLTNGTDIPILPSTITEKGTPSHVIR